MKLRKTMSVILALVMILGIFSVVPAAAADSEAAADWEYTLDEEAGTIILNKYIGASDTLTVPGSFDIDDRTYAAVLSSNTVFRANTVLKSISFESGVGFVNSSMRLLFGECSALTSVDLSALDTSSVDNLSYIFYNCTKLKTVDISALSAAQPTTIRGMFSGCSALTDVDVSGLDTSQVTDMSYLFYNCEKLQTLDLSAFATSQVKEIRAIFSGCRRLSGLTGYQDWDTSSLENMSFAFNYFAYALNAATQVTVDLSRWDLSNLKNSGWCFQFCRAQTILVPENIAVMSAGFMNHAVRYAGSTYTIPAGVKKIGYAHTFYDFATNDFTEFIVDDGNTEYQAIDGVLYSADGKEMLAVPRNKPFEDGVFEIAEGVDFLGELSFSRNYNIHTVVLPDSYEIEYVPVYDDRYIVFEDTGNLNAGTNLSVAIYCYTGITDYAVKETNPRYTSADGIIYSKDMTHVVAIPARYNKAIVIPEGVTDWDREAMWADGSATVDNLLANCTGITLPSTLRNISEDQLEMINRLHKNRADSDNPFTIAIDGESDSFSIDESGNLHYAVEITTQPGDTETELGETASTSFVAEGEGLKYQWYGRDPGQKDFWKSSLKGDTYSVKLVKSKIGREVYCVVTDKYGNTAKTRTATLNVKYPEGYQYPTIETQPESAYADAGETASVTFTASGEDLTYQWYGRNTGEEKFWKSSIKTDTYSVTMNTKRNGREIYCVVTDKYGNTAQTETVTLNFLIPEGYELKAENQPESITVAKNKTAKTTFTVSGAGVKYQWYGRDPGQTKFWKSSIKSDTYSVTMVSSKSGREIYCVATDKYGNSITSDTVTLNMK